MNTCAALLRGINVGRKNSLPIKELIVILEGIGAQRVGAMQTDFATHVALNPVNRAILLSIQAGLRPQKQKLRPSPSRPSAILMPPLKSPTKFVLASRA